MNYRHHFHAGNFADVMKHVLLGQLLRAMQKKDKGLVCVDTHAGRGRYDLAAAATGDSLERKPEWPEGIGRLWTCTDAPPAVADYLGLVRDFDRRNGNLSELPRFYPGSPWIARLLLRDADRLALCEKHPAECAALRQEFAGEGRRARISIQEMDGYVAVRAMLPPPERRALVLIDPPYESQDEFAQVAAALREALTRFPSAVIAVWYPLTLRARIDAFFTEVVALNPPPTVALELAVAGEESPLKMKGCGLAIINPPWQFAEEMEPALQFLADRLAQEPGGGARIEWLVREK